MPPNPRDNLYGRPVPLANVQRVVIEAMVEVIGHDANDDAAALIVQRLLHFGLLAPDVEGMVGRREYEMLGAGQVAVHTAEDPIPPLPYCRCVPCCCKEGQGHKSAEYRAWEMRVHEVP